MKWILLLILMLVLVVSLFACGVAEIPSENLDTNGSSENTDVPGASENPDVPDTPDGTETDTRQDFKVMSFNMQTDAATVAERAPHAVEYIAAFDADVVGAQEVNCYWLDELEELCFFETYAMVGEARQGDAAAASNEYSCIFYKKDLFTLIDSGTFWLSDTPDEISKFDDSDYYRIMSYAFLQRNSDGECFLSVNTHLEWNHGDGGINLAQTETLLYLTDYVREENVPVIFTGDFNEPPTSDGYAAMLAWGCEDTRTVAKNTSNACTFFDGYRGEMTDPDSEGTVLDYCFVSAGDFDVSRFTVGTDCDVSDHFPVFVTMKFREGS